MTTTKFTLSSTAFEDGKPIPSKYAYRGVTGGRNVSIPLHWENPPSESKSFVLTCVDLHPIANGWVHWLVTNIPPATREIPEGASGTGKMPSKSIELMNSYGEKGYGGPHPPEGSGRHKYEFTLYALNVENLEVTTDSSLSVVLGAIEGKVLMKAIFSGIFER